MAGDRFAQCDELENALKIAIDDLANAIDKIVDGLGITEFDFEETEDGSEVVVDKRAFEAVQRTHDDTSSEIAGAFENFAWALAYEIRRLKKALATHSVVTEQAGLDAPSAPLRPPLCSPSARAETTL